MLEVTCLSPRVIMAPGKCTSMSAPITINWFNAHSKNFFIETSSDPKMIRTVYALKEGSYEISTPSSNAEFSLERMPCTGNSSSTKGSGPEYSNRLPLSTMSSERLYTPGDSSTKLSVTEDPSLN